MARIAFLVLLFAVAAALLFVISNCVKSTLAAEDKSLGRSGGNMQRLAFFLLLALMAYVAATGGA